MTPAELLSDLRAERTWVAGMVGGLDDDGWATATPAEGWTVRDQIWHLAFYDAAATQSLARPDEFRREAARAEAALDSYLAGVEGGARVVSGDQSLQAWRRGWDRFDAAARGAGDLRAPWYGVEMSVASLVTARLMETWAHGVDVADSLGAPLPESDRVAHVVFLGYRALPFSFRLHGRIPPEDPVRIEVTAPSGRLVELGPEGSPARVTGPAMDLALVVTQRRHVDDTALQVEGAADEWMQVAQAFAGPPGPGRPPRNAAGTQARQTEEAPGAPRARGQRRTDEGDDDDEH